MTDTIDLIKIGRGTVWHIVASANETDRVKSYWAYCGVQGEAAGPERDIDARVIRHRGANVCANCRNQLTLKNPTEGGTTVSSITDDLQGQASEAAAAAQTHDPPAAKAKGGTATATRTRGRKGKTKLSAIAAAEQILRKEAKPLHVKQITEQIQAMPETKLGGKTPDATVGAILAVASKKPGSVFRRTKPGTYAIRKGK